MAHSRKGTHKRRSVWFNARTAWPRREARVQNLVRERVRAFGALLPHPGRTEWESVGPTNVGGRMTCAVTHPVHPETIWAGAACGGIWKSINGGRSWRALWHDQATLNIGSLAIDPVNPEVLYCGTGEANLSSDCYPGVGIYRSIDGGESWQVLAPSEAAGIPARIGSIAIDPFDPNHLRIGGVAHDKGDRDGMFVSHNGGLSWGRVNAFTSAAYRCHAVLFHPARRGTLFATIAARGSRSGIWRSTDGGATWRQLAGGLPSGDAMGRISLAFAPSKPSVMYALAENDSDTVLGVFKTTDGGATWRNVAHDHFEHEEQLSYGNTIVVHPTDHDTVICGGVDLHRTLDGGRSWHKVTHWDKEPGEKKYAHSDHHCLLMPAAQPGLVYSLNDGGLDVSADSGTSWDNRSKDLVTSLFYDIDVAQSHVRMFGGGMQDNGTNVTFDGDPGAFREKDGGDGGWFLVNPKDSNEYYTTSYNMDMSRHRGKAPPKSVTPPAKKAEKDKIWMMFLALDPNDPRTVFAGGLRVWRTKTAGDTWKAVTDELDESAITAVEVANDSRTIYAGTENGGIFCSRDGGDHWSGDLSGSVPGFTVTRLFANPDDASDVYVTIANSGASHVYRSSDAGRTWTDVDRHRLPDVPHHAIAIPTGKPSTVFVGNDAGVYVSTNAGGDWKNLTRNLPNVQIVDLVYHDRTRTLFAASYGRGIWRIKI